MKNQVQLITYTDRLGGGLNGHDLRDLRRLLSEPGALLSGLFGGIHLLPFFNAVDGSDAGFDPINHTEVDDRLGSWADIQALAQDFDLVADLIVNHISSDSPQFQDFSRNGSASEFAGLFLTLDRVFPGGATETDLMAVYRPRPGLPLTGTTLENGERHILWTTFTSSQIDIAVRDPQGRKYLSSILRKFADHGIKVVRLNAVGYAIKKAGASCFLMPETLEFVDDLTVEARALGIQVLVDLHAHYLSQVEIAKRVDWVYDFALPPLVLHAFSFKTAVTLKRWIGIRPDNSVNVLDTHDGIGIIDVGADAHELSDKAGLLESAELAQLVERIHRASDFESRKATGAGASNLDSRQINCTFFDAMGRNEKAYLLARAIQFFLPGVPQVYYVGLLAGRNDVSLLGHTGVGRDINRRYYAWDDIELAFERTVVCRLAELIKIRNSHPAFAGQFFLHQTPDDELLVSWHADDADAVLGVNFTTLAHELQFRSNGSETVTVSFDDL